MSLDSSTYLFYTHWNPILKDAPGFRKSSVTMSYTWEDYEINIQHALIKTRIDNDTQLAPSIKVEVFKMSLDEQSLVLINTIYQHRAPEKIKKI